MTIIICHGGAGTYEPELKPKANAGCVQAVTKAYHAMKTLKLSAVDTAKLTIIELENSPHFNAGFGGVPNEHGIVETDSMIATDADNSLGCVASVTNVKNPVLLADCVRRYTPHSFVVGKGAEIFAEKISQRVNDEIAEKKIHDFEKITLLHSNKELLTEDQLNSYNKYNSFSSWLQSEVSNTKSHDTVGCVVLDDDGNLAIATSTGGLLRKMHGRVGDAPLYGCGGYIGQHSAFVATGHGESLMKSTACSSISHLIEDKNVETELAIKTVLDNMSARFNGFGGVVGINKKNSKFALYFNTTYMSWAAITNTEKDTFEVFSNS